MRILFTHSYFLHYDPKQVAHAQPYPPLGTLVAASAVREKGFKVQLFDPMFAGHPDEIIPALEKFKPDVLVVYDDGFNYLTKMCLSNMRRASFVMQEHARKYNCKVIVTSSDAADHYATYLRNQSHFVMIGEAENTLVELLNAIKKNAPDYEFINGLAYLRNGEPFKTPARAVSKKPDEFPLPAWDLVNIEPYERTWKKKHGYFSINVATTRGCPYKCNWCAKPIYGNMYNMRSPQNVIDEIKMLKERFDFSHIWFCDDIFGLKRSWVSEFAALVQKENLKFRYKIQSRADLLVQEQYVEDLAASGCDDVWLGAESGSQAILDAMDKGTTVEQIKEARALLKKHNIKASFFLQFGYPGETFDDIKKTIALVKETMPDDIGISVSYPLPGTLFYENVKDQLQKTNWTDSDEMALLFRNTYSAGFYKQLHHYVHQLYRRTKAEKRIRIMNRFTDLKKLLAWPFYNRATKKSYSKLRQTEPDANISI